MLKRLTVNNYALIGNAQLDFPEGLTILTGETGAGKSILMGALALILGQRADTSVIKRAGKKCIVEGEFDLSALALDGFFKEHNLDQDATTLVRREIGTDGKSRAFINDTPVNLALLKEFGASLVDVHSQHETLSLNDRGFQLSVLDALAGNKQVLARYTGLFHQYSEKKKHLLALREREEQGRSELDYLHFLFNELSEAALKDPEEQERMESELALLSNAGQLQKNIGQILHALSDGQQSVNSQLSLTVNLLQQSARMFDKLNEPAARLQSALIELKDIVSEIEHLGEQISSDPQRIELLQERLDQFSHLQKKHRVNTLEELLQVQTDLSQRIDKVSSLGDEITDAEAQVEQLEQTLKKLAADLSASRKKVISQAEKEMQRMLASVGMPAAVFKVKLETLGALSSEGIDRAIFLFTANKGVEPDEIGRVASGGELSRLMLCLKSLVASKVQWPTLIFDEIDSGISGETAFRVGDMIHSIGIGRQVICITHLPQIAARGTCHYQVYKDSSGDATTTNLRKLQKEERVSEIARMLGGENPTAVAVENARELLAL